MQASLHRACRNRNQALSLPALAVALVLCWRDACRPSWIGLGMNLIVSTVRCFSRVFNRMA